MSSAPDHDRWAKEMFTEAESLVRTVKLRWATVAIFYSALHMVHNALPLLPGVDSALQHPSAHTGPDGVMTAVRLHLPGIEVPYRTLFDASLDARYNGGVASTQEVDAYRHRYLPQIGEAVCRDAHHGDGCWMYGL